MDSCSTIIDPVGIGIGNQFYPHKEELNGDLLTLIIVRTETFNKGEYVV